MVRPSIVFALFFVIHTVPMHAMISVNNLSMDDRDKALDPTKTTYLTLNLSSKELECLDGLEHYEDAIEEAIRQNVVSINLVDNNLEILPIASILRIFPQIQNIDASKNPIHNIQWPRPLPHSLELSLNTTHLSTSDRYHLKTINPSVLNRELRSTVGRGLCFGFLGGAAIGTGICFGIQICEELISHHALGHNPPSNRLRPWLAQKGNALSESFFNLIEHEFIVPPQITIIHTAENDHA